MEVFGSVVRENRGDEEVVRRSQVSRGCPRVRFRHSSRMPMLIFNLGNLGLAWPAALGTGYTFIRIKPQSVNYSPSHWQPWCAVSPHKKLSGRYSSHYRLAGVTLRSVNTEPMKAPLDKSNNVNKQTSRLRNKEHENCVGDECIISGRSRHVLRLNLSRQVR